MQITGNTTWANSARDALKEQCLEVLHRNANLPKDMAQKLASLICINDCSQHGTCVKGRQYCNEELYIATVKEVLFVGANLHFQGHYCAYFVVR
jgi:hypothetical protein